jgi:urease accessory protein
MGGPEMAPQTPPSASRAGQGLARSGDHGSEAGQGLARSGDHGSEAGQGLARSGDHGSEGVPVITEARGYLSDGELVGRERDALVLTAEERRWGRRRVRTQTGRELILALPTGSLLTPGNVLHVEADWYVVVEPAAEPVIAVTPRSREEAIRVAFEVGNRHFALALDGERMLVPDDTAMEQLLGRLDVPWTRTRAVFVPVGAGHRHDH